MMGEMGINIKGDQEGGFLRATMTREVTGGSSSQRWGESIVNNR